MCPSGAGGQNARGLFLSGESAPSRRLAKLNAESLAAEVLGLRGDLDQGAGTTTRSRSSVLVLVAGVTDEH